MIVHHPQAREFIERMRGARSVRIGTHLNPDGDAIGSALAVMHALDGLGVPNEALCVHPAPWNLRFLPGAGRIRQEPTREADLGVVLDLDSLDRLGRLRQHFEGLPGLVVVDHHLPHAAPGDLRIIDAESPATALILGQLFAGGGIPLTPAIAQCLLTGIVTDTGGFRYSNTNAAAIAMASELQALGGDIVRVCEQVYQRKPLPAVRLLGRALDRMKLEGDGKVAYATLRLEDFRETGALEAHSEGIVNELLFIDTVQAAALIREPEPGKVHASLRSRDAVDVSAAARPFGGGGHRNAAGCTFHAPIEDAEHQVAEALHRAVQVRE
jgi:phosphoesterase RecJ-like protein